MVKVFAPHELHAAEKLTVLHNDLNGSISALAIQLAKMDHKFTPCTYQTYRALGGMMNDAGDALAHMVETAGIHFLNRDVVKVDLLDITEKLGAAEKVIDDVMMLPFKLDELPPGNPGEKEFEALLKPKIALNKAYSEAMHKFANLHNALYSKTYAINISEKDRCAAWRADRKARLEAVLVDIDQEREKAQAFLDALNKSRGAVILQLEGNDQMTFDQEIDTAKIPTIE